jgi:hypothetical protein
MPSYGNFRNSFKRNAEGEDLFKNPKQSVKESDITGARRDNLIDWITFYRRNMHRFIEHYFGITLYPYQILWLYEMSVSDSYVAICSRAVGKTWLIAVFACAIAVLYPNSEIVIVSSTKEQAGIVVSDKIASLRVNHPNLAREISNVVTNMNKWQVDFHNGSVIKVVASRDSARGKRATFLIFEEFRLIDKSVLDSVIRPFAYIRQTPYLKNPIYQHLIEEPKEVFISSAYHKGLWWFEETKHTIKAMLKGENVGFISLDYLIAIFHNIKTPRQIKSDIKKMDSITVMEEIFNIPWGESASSYFRLKMFDRSRSIKKAFYPQRIETYNPKKNPYGIIKSEGEIRLVSCDIAQRAGKANDLSITACVRLLPTRKGYFRELLFLESFNGVDSITQSLRIKQVFHDFEGDVIVLDVANAGIAVLDQLGVITADPERGIEYPAMTVIPHSSIDSSTYDELSKRTLGINALQVIYPLSGNAKLNSTIAVEMRDKLQKKMWGFLIDETSAEDYLIRSTYSKEFLSQDDAGAKATFLLPYVQTSLMVNEFVNLSMFMNAGNIKLVESPGSRKDRYTSISYSNYYASLLDQDLLKQESNEDDFDFVSSLIQHS